MKVNYNEISKVYDDVREEDIPTISSFLEGVNLDENSTILDIGCGTGNYTNLLQKLTGARVYGLDASEGMIAKAKEKNKHITFVQGDAQGIPFEKDFFDFVYMTDVIHHVPDIDKMFSQIYEVLKPKGKVCIVTQSHRQIELRVTTMFFPETCTVDKFRYPHINKIRENAEKNNLGFVKEDAIEEGIDTVLDEHFLELVEKKGYSMMHLISEEGYKQGVEMVKEALSKGPITKKSAGLTMVWFVKKA